MKADHERWIVPPWQRARNPSPFVPNEPEFDPSYGARANTPKRRQTIRDVVKSDTDRRKKNVPNVSALIATIRKGSIRSGSFVERFAKLAEGVPTFFFSPRWEKFRAGLRLACIGALGLFLLSFLLFLGSAFTPAERVDATRTSSRGTRSSTTTTDPTYTSRTTETYVARQRKTSSAPPTENGDIPTVYSAAYRDASARCGLDWTALAAIGKIESDHGRSTLPGVKSGSNAAGAAGPMQFLPNTWELYAIDGNRDGKLNVYDPVDAIHSAANLLCQNGGNSSFSSALSHYNNSPTYASTVREVAKQLTSRSSGFPLPIDSAAAIDSAELHHDYPAIDIPTLVGTPFFAVRSGTVERIDDNVCGLGVRLTDEDGNVFTYCHASALSTSSGVVSAGTRLGTTGGRPNTRGAGDSTGPHLHLQMDVNNELRCPASVLRAWAAGESYDLSRAPTTNCVA